jgi:DNA-binding PadR family transcriptional regulator
MSKRADVLELAVLGLLQEAPMHGYELRKRLTNVLGWGRALSYGSLYPCLKDLVRADLITEDEPVIEPAGSFHGRRGKIVYKLTAEGKERLGELLADAGPATWEDDTFGVHLAFFARTDRDVRMRILEGRRTRLEERREGARSAVSRARERLDAYTLELHRHGLESVEREVRWLTELISVEQAGGQPADPTSPSPAAPTTAALVPVSSEPIAAPHRASDTTSGPKRVGTARASTRS